MKDPVDPLIDTLGYTFKDRRLLLRALRHRSAEGENNERLEFLGDAVLGMIISQELFQRLRDAPEGDLSRLRAQLVQKHTLARVARGLGLGQYLILGMGESKSGGAERESILADALEAVIAALFLDGGLEMCRERVVEWFAGELNDADLSSPPKDSKTRLQEFLQSRGEPLPDYRLETVKGKAHDQTFIVYCKVTLLAEATRGEGNTRREAEQQAAEQVLKNLRQ